MQVPDTHHSLIPSGQCSPKCRLSGVDYPWLLLLAGGIVGIYWKSLFFGEFWWSDEARHAMDGVFFMDLFQDLPWQAPVDYALRYFAQYPAIAPNWYPPVFAIIEAIFFKAFGINEVVARFTILGFALCGAVTWYFWTRLLWGRAWAVLSCLLYLSAPGVLIWTRSVMLEVAAVAMIIFSVYIFDRYLDRPTFRSAILAGMALALTLLLKQTTVFIIPVLLGYAIVSNKREALIRREAFSAYFIVSMALIGLFLHAVYFGTTATETIIGGLGTDKPWGPGIFNPKRWEMHWLALWETSGFPLIAAAIGGAFSLLRFPPQRQDALFLLWIIGWYFMATALISSMGNAGRYTMYVLPAIAALACRPFANFVPGNDILKHGGLLLVCATVVWNLWSDWTHEHPFVSGYKEAADFVHHQEIPGPILFAGKHDGNFVFHLRAKDNKRKKIVLRGDKILLSMSVIKAFGVTSYVKNQTDILSILDRYGIGIIVVESRDLVGLKEFSILHELLRSSNFELLKKIPIKTNIPAFKNTDILIYSYLNQTPNINNTIVIPLPHLKREITFKSQQP